METRNKITIFRKIRKKQRNKISLDAISEKTHISKDWIGNLERGEIDLKEDDTLKKILELAKAYESDSKRLCRNICSDQCPIGKYLELEHVDEDGQENIGLIILNIIDAINKLTCMDINRIVEITKDGIIDESELTDYYNMKDILKEFSSVYNSLIRWEEENQIGIPIK